MTANQPQFRLGALSPLVLRLVVAGVLAAAASGKLPAPPVTTDRPLAPLSETAPPAVENPLDAAAPPVATSEPLGGMIDRAPGAQATLDADGLKVDFGWPKLIRASEFGFAFLLLFGLLTRWAALAGVGTVKLAVLGACGMVPATSLGPLVEMYTANPVAMLLFGAICLSLLVSGSGPLGADRVLFRRKRQAAALGTADTLG